VDFTGITLDAATGRLMFHILEPFGDRNQEYFRWSCRRLRFVIPMHLLNLYDIKQTDARTSSKNGTFFNIWFIKRRSFGSFTLGFGLVEGSVKVFANNVELTEDSD